MQIKTDNSMNQPLVSIITPCYNGEKFVSRFLDSILRQTYNNIELIIVDDGSTDNTLDILKSYSHKFNERGFNYIVIHQKNLGQSEAINQGLKIFRGEYLSWLDSDDCMPDNAIECKVSFLEANPDLGLCICKVQYFDDKTGEMLGMQQRIAPKGEDHLFEDILNRNNSVIACGAYMVRTSMFRSVMPNPIRIATPRLIGQNYQMILPIAYSYPCGYIDKVLYFVGVRRNSHSRTTHDFYHMMKVCHVVEDVLNDIVSNLKTSEVEKARLYSLVKKHCLIMSIENCYNYNMLENVSCYISAVKTLDCLSYDEKLRIFILRYPILSFPLKLISVVIRKLKGRV